MIALKLTGAARFISKNAGVRNVLERGGVVEVTQAQSEYLLNLSKKDRSNNIHPLFVVTDEKAGDVAAKKMTTQQRLAAAVAKEAAEASAEAGEEAEKPPVKKRRKSRAKAKPAAPVEPTETPAP